MKAAFIKEHGGADKLLYGEMPDPVAKADEALLRVRACSLNHIDIWVRNGSPAYPVKLPHIMGSDMAGEVVGTGEKVFVMPGISCGQCPYCLAGQDNQCQTFRIVGALGPGGYAELVAVPKRNLYPLPNGLTFEEAASFPLTFLTAWHMLVTRGQLKSGDAVLILGAGSGVGAAGIQIAKAAGARVMAVSSSEDKLQKAKELGADILVNGTKGDFSQKAREWTEGRGVDVVFEHIGPVTWEKSVKSLAPYGRLVTCGATTGPSVNLDLRYVFSRNLSILGSRLGTRAELEKLRDLFEKKRLKPVISHVLPLSEARKAHELLEAQSQLGKIVLKVD